MRSPRLSRLPGLRALAVASCLVSGRAHSEAAQANGTSGSVFVGCGYLLVENHSKTSFTVLLRSKDVQQEPVEGDAIFVVDGVLIQVTSSTAAEVGFPHARGLELLKRHRDWEIKFAQAAQHWKTLSPSGDPVDVGLGRAVRTMMWGYDAPSPIEVLGQKVNRMLYLTAAVDDVVFVMASPLRAEDDAGRVGLALRKHMSTLRREPKPLDLGAVSVASKRGPWQGCRGP